MKCAKCGRELKNPRSRELGYGPVCYRELFGSSKQLQYKIRRVSSKRHTGEPHEQVPGQISMNNYLQTLLME